MWRRLLILRCSSLKPPIQHLANLSGGQLRAVLLRKHAKAAGIDWVALARTHCAPRPPPTRWTAVPT